MRVFFVFVFCLLSISVNADYFDRNGKLVKGDFFKKCESVEDWFLAPMLRYNAVAKTFGRETLSQKDVYDLICFYGGMTCNDKGILKSSRLSLYEKTGLSIEGMEKLRPLVSAYMGMDGVTGDKCGHFGFDPFVINKFMMSFGRLPQTKEFLKLFFLRLTLEEMLINVGDRLILAAMPEVNWLDSNRRGMRFKMPFLIALNEGIISIPVSKSGSGSCSSGERVINIEENSKAPQKTEQNEHFKDIDKILNGRSG